MAGEQEFGSLQAHQFYMMNQVNRPVFTRTAITNVHVPATTGFWGYPLFFYRAVVQFAVMKVKQIHTGISKLRADLS